MHRRPKLLGDLDRACVGATSPARQSAVLPHVHVQLAKRDSRTAQNAPGHKRIDTTAQEYVLDQLEEGLTDDLY
jgi:hypothetical protein